jgi:hypothetical protein
MYIYILKYVTQQEAPEEPEDRATQHEAPEKPDVEDEADGQT